MRPPRLLPCEGSVSFFLSYFFSTIWIMIIISHRFCCYASIFDSWRGGQWCGDVRRYAAVCRLLYTRRETCVEVRRDATRQGGGAHGARLVVLDFHIGTPTFTQGKQVLHGHHYYHHHTPIMTLELPVSLTSAIWPRTVCHLK